MTVSDYMKFSNFKSYREGQEEVISQVTSSEAKYTVLNMPTGGGKSLCGMSISYGRSVYTVTTKMLQDQLSHDFPEAVILKGRNNYPCPRYTDDYLRVYADNCYKRGCGYIPECPYEAAKMGAIKADYRVLNLPYYLSETNLSIGNFSGQDIAIIDEADHLEQQLVDFISMELSPKDMKLLENYNCPEPQYYTKPDTWKPWAKECMRHLTGDILSLAKIVEKGNPPDEILKNYKQVKRLYTKLNILHEHCDSNWLRYTDKDKIIYKPIWLTPELSRQFLFRHAARWVFMSATFPAYEIYCRLLGIPQTEGEYIELPSPFPIENRPIYYEPVCDMSYKSQRDGNAVNILLIEVGKLLQKYNNVKGIIHSTSYKLNEAIMSINNPRLITHNSKDKEAVISKFKSTNKPYVLVSPSIERGVSFDDDMARFCIIPKVPYQSLTDRIVSARLYSGKFGEDWYQADAAQRIVQMAGRGVRSASDYCDCVSPDTKILTNDLQWLYAGELKIGDKLLAFDEREGTRINPRRWRWAYVMNTGIENLQRYRIILRDGQELISTPNHMWLSKWAQSRDDSWIRTDKLRKGHHLNKYINVWHSIKSWEAGWLAGFFDGEGCLTFSSGKRNPSVFGLCVTQNAGILLDKVEEISKLLGFSTYIMQKDVRTCYSMKINGGIIEILKFLGQIRPYRLLKKFIESERKERFMSNYYNEIIHIEKIGNGPMVTLESSSGTYIAEGYAAHNTYILDSQFSKLLQRPRYFPRWFLEGVKIW